MHRGYIKLWRKFKEWEWYDDINTKVLFLHLLLNANFEDKNWRGIIIKRGEYLTGLKSLKKETKISIRSLRTSLSNLKSTGETTSKITNKYRIIKLNNYELYNQNDNQNDKRATSKRQANDKQTTTTKKEKNYKNYKNIISKDITEQALGGGGGNVEINKMLIALKAKVGISDFVDSKTERFFAKHCVSLLKKIGIEEFEKRLTYLIQDSFTHKNCNKIKYIYNNLKGYIQPKPNII